MSSGRVDGLLIITAGPLPISERGGGGGGG